MPGYKPPEVLVFDTRRVTLNFPAGTYPDLYTARGRTPIAVTSVQLTYAIHEDRPHELVGAEAVGEPTDPDDQRRLAHKKWRNITRRVDFDAMPSWMLGLAAKHHPPYVVPVPD